MFTAIANVLGNGISTNISYNSNYQAILTRATTLGYSLPSSSQQIKQNRLVVDLVDASIWNSLDLLYIYATDGDSNYATLNWKSSSFQCSKVNSPGFTVNAGFNTDGATSYLDTNWIPSTDAVAYTQNSASFGLWMHTGVATTTLSVAMGIESSSQMLIFDNNSVLAARINNGATNINFTGSANFTNSSMYAVSRTSSTAVQTHVNGTQVASGSITSVALNTNKLFVLRRNVSSALYLPAAAKIAIVFVGSSSIDQVTLYNIFNTYMTSL